MPFIPTPSKNRPAILLRFALACLLLLISPNWKPDQDSVAYLSMARSLAQGRGMLHLGLQQWHYAPFYSVLISPAFLLPGPPFLWISIINIATAWVFVLGAFWWFRRYSKRSAGFVAALVGVNIGLWDVCREPRADTLFSALFIWSAVFFAWAVDARNLRSFLVCTTFATGALVLVCCTRQVGIFLAAGFAVAVFIRWRFDLTRMLFCLIPGIAAAIVVIALAIRDHHAATHDHAGAVVTYLNQYRQPGVTLTAQLIDGFRRQTADVGRLLLPGMWGSFAHYGQWLNFNTIFYVLFAIPVAIAWWRLTRRTADPLLWTVPFYAAMFVVWPFDQGTRFNVPMLPVLWACIWMMLNRWRSRRVLILAVVLALHILVSICYLVGDGMKVARWNNTIPPMADLARRINDDRSVATIGGAPNDIPIWRYLLDRPVINYPVKTASLPMETIWILQRKETDAPVGFGSVASSDGFELYHRN